MDPITERILKQRIISKRYYERNKDAKKQKYQEDAILLSAIEPPLPQPNTTIDSMPTPLDSLIQHPITPILPQPFPQPETKEPTSNETALNDPNQEYMATETHESKPHSMPATEPPSEPPPHGIATSTSPLMTEPLLPQSEIPMIPLDTVTRGFNPHAVPTMEPSSEPPPHEFKTLAPELVTPMTPLLTSPDQAQHRLTPRPPEYESWTNNKKYNWRRRFEPTKY
jgi:hypothetical protein